MEAIGFLWSGGDLADEAEFRALVEENAVHQSQCAGLCRRTILSRAITPWGPSQQATVYAESIICHSTASHGGFHLDPPRNAFVHTALRSADGWYEEDCCWAAAAHAFPELFTDFEKRCADKTIRDYYPDTWEAIHGKSLEPGQSHEMDQRDFLKRHTADWIVLSAICSDQTPGYTECVATVGGSREMRGEQRRYLVPTAEYATSRFGFVIDEVRHRLYDGPSSFTGWNRKVSS